jgi:hypothetical protein
MILNFSTMNIATLLTAFGGIMGALVGFYKFIDSKFASKADKTVVDKIDLKLDHITERIDHIYDRMINGKSKEEKK